MRRSRAVSVIAVAAVSGLLLAGCAERANTGGPSGGAQAVGFPETPPNPVVPGRPGGVFRLGIVEPTAIDPYNVQESEGANVSEQLFTGLVEVQPDGTVAPGVASRWSSDEQCRVWTFTLKPGTTFHNGEVVDAAAFKRGWERAAAPNSGSEVSYHLDVIAGYDEFQGGAAPEITGVDTTDPDRLVVTLDQPDCEFALRTEHPVYSPVPAVAGPAGNQAYNDQPIGNGPFRMDGPWRHNEGIRLVRFEGYAAGPKAYLDAVEYTILPSANAVQLEYDGFVNGQFDWARVPPPLLAQARARFEPRGQWISKKVNGINYLTVMVTQPPLDTPQARKAISLAINRAAISEGIFRGSQAPATALVPPVFEDVYRPGVCGACRYDPEEARRLAEQAGLTPGTEVNLQFNTGGGHEEWTAAVRQQLEQNLGLVVNYSGVPFTDLLNNEAAPGASGLFRAAWGADYPTPGNFLVPLLATSSIGAGPDEPVTGNNYGRYSNPEFDALVARATGTRDEAQRAELWRRAEQIAIGRDLAVIPMWERQQYRLAATDRFNNINLTFNVYPSLHEISLK